MLLQELFTLQYAHLLVRIFLFYSTSIAVPRCHNSLSKTKSSSQNCLFGASIASYSKCYCIYFSTLSQMDLVEAGENYNWERKQKFDLFSHFLSPGDSRRALWLLNPNPQVGIESQDEAPWDGLHHWLAQLQELPTERPKPGRGRGGAVGGAGDQSDGNIIIIHHHHNHRCHHN